MEKTLTRLRTNLKSRRKLSLPMLVGQFHWNSSSGAGGADDVRSPPLRQLSATSAASVNSEDDEQQDAQEQQEPTETRPPSNEREKQTSSKTWLGFGKSKTSTSANSSGTVGALAVSPSTSSVASSSFSTAVDNKNRRKPRRWPSTPAFMPAGTTRPVPTITGSNSHQFIGTTSSSPSSIDHQQQQPCTAAADVISRSCARLMTSAAATRHGLHHYNLSFKATT